MNRAASVKFPRAQNDFLAQLNQRVNEYFKTNNLSRNANAEMVIKTIIMFTAYLVPYVLLVTGIVTQLIPAILMVVIMGFAIAGIGLSVMHDANHGAYSSKKWINNLLGFSLNIIGGNAFNWKVQHNVLHHTYTNVHDADEDISPRGVLRMHPNTPWKSFHRYQHVYAWFFYGLMTIVWVFVKDFIRLINYGKEGLIKKQRAHAGREWLVLLLSKVIYAGYVFLVPLWLTSFLWWQIVLGILIMHYIAGFILAIIFQPAHVIDGTEYPEPNESGMLATAWAEHQLRTTTNFANGNKPLSWYVGGLNFQVEHHLFPHVCHVHYRNLAPIVKATALEFGLPYKSEPTFFQALVSHTRLLKKLGEKPALA